MTERLSGNITGKRRGKRNDVVSSLLSEASEGPEDAGI